MTLDIHPLTPDRFTDLAGLFEEGGDPKWCWCTYFRVRGRNWTNASPADNRIELESLATHDPAPGLLALRDGRAIGWVSLGPRTDFDRLAHSRLYAPIDDDPCGRSSVSSCRDARVVGASPPPSWRPRSTMPEQTEPPRSKPIQSTPVMAACPPRKSIEGRSACSSELASASWHAVSGTIPARSARSSASSSRPQPNDRRGIELGFDTGPDTRVSSRPVRKLRTQIQPERRRLRMTTKTFLHRCLAPTGADAIGRFVPYSS